MATTRKVTFSPNTIQETDLQNMKKRIKAVFSSSSVDAATPATGSTATFAQLKGVYDAAVTAIKALGGTNSRTLGSFQGAILKGAHGIGITEKTVGDLEQLCTSHKGSNKAVNDTSDRGTFTASKNSGNFSGNANNDGDRSNFTASKNSSKFSSNGAVHSSNFVGNDSSDFSGNTGNSTDRSSGEPFSYMLFHASQSGAPKVTVHSGVCKTNWGANAAANSGNRSGNNSSNCDGNANKNSNRSDFTAAVIGSNFNTNGTVNSSKRSTFTAAVNGTNFTGNNGSNFSSNTKVCNTVHSTFTVEGVDF